MSDELTNFKYVEVTDTWLEENHSQAQLLKGQHDWARKWDSSLYYATAWFKGERFYKTTIVSSRIRGDVTFDIEETLREDALDWTQDNYPPKEESSEPIGGEMENLTIELAGCTGVLLREIADKKFFRKDIARTYSLTMMSSEKTDYAIVNQAIINRWSISGLTYIKELAWKLLEEKRE